MANSESNDFTSEPATRLLNINPVSPARAELLLEATWEIDGLVEVTLPLVTADAENPEGYIIRAALRR